MGKLDMDNNVYAKSIERKFKKLKQDSNENALNFYGPGHPHFILIEIYKALDNPNHQIKNFETKNELALMQFSNNDGYIYPFVREVLNKSELGGDFSPFAFDCSNLCNCQ